MTGSTAGAVLRTLLPVPLPQPLSGTLERILGLRQAEDIYRNLVAMGAQEPFPDRLLRYLEINCQVPERDLEQIPKRGPALLVVNHPFGILDGAVIASILLRLRPDVKLLANEVLAAVPELGDLLIQVDPMGGDGSARRNGRGLRAALDFLRGGGLLVIFPAGEVAHFQWREHSVTDPEWNPAAARIASFLSRRLPELLIVTAYCAGRNSFLFHALGVVHPRLRTAMLAHELVNKRRRHVDIRIGRPIAAEKLLAIPTDRERTEYLRWRTYLLASREQFKPRTALPLLRGRKGGTPEPVAQPVSPDLLASEVQALPRERLLLASGDFEVYVSPACEIPSTLNELGRLRELTFRAAGEGTGKYSDIDSFDAHYLHLFVWNRVKREIVGAYRLACVDRVRIVYGVRGLYTATLFKYSQEFLDRLGPSLELGRSFVRPEYQRSVAPLLLLWKGIGKYVAANPRYKVLFGPVSISNQYQPVSQQLIVSFLERHAWLPGWADLVASRRPFRRQILRRQTRGGQVESGLDIEDLSDVVADVDPGREGIPVLLRQYLKLGGKLVGFNVDPEFSHTLDGLILVDLTKTNLKILERYLGKDETAAFLAFHRGGYGNDKETSDIELDTAGSRGGDSSANAVLQIQRGG